MKNLFKDWQVKALFGFIVAFLVAFIGAILYTLYINIGLYLFVWLFGILFFYIVGHALYEIERRNSK